MTAYDAIRYLHILAGTIALTAYWTAATLRKGSSGHRLVGRTFMIMILILSATGAVIAASALQRGQTVTGAFLLFLVLITLTPTWTAWRAIKDKTDVKRFVGPVYLTLAWLNVAAGAIVLYLGVIHSQVIIMGVSLVGLIGGAFMLKFARTPPTDRQWWLKRHYISMLAVGIATHVAFLNIGLSRLLPHDMAEVAQRLSWFTPFAVAFIARLWLQRKYTPKSRTAAGREIRPAQG